MQTVQKTSFFLQVQLLDKVDMPVVVQRQVRWSDGAENSGVPQVQYFDRVVDVPAAVHRQGLDVPCPVGGASDSVQQNWIMTAVKGFFGAFCAFFRAPPVIRS